MAPGPEGHDHPAPLVRPAARADADAVFALADMLAISFPIDRAGFDRTFPDVLDVPGTQLLVAEVDGRVRGYLLGFVHPTFYANGPVAWVEELAVLPDDRRRGLGARLMHEFEDRARVDGARLVALATTRAAAFYQPIGYERRADYFRRTIVDKDA
jgi:GNAT superfamily N-acetyltransferase